jgi:hypothetical protein
LRALCRCRRGCCNQRVRNSYRNPRITPTVKELPAHYNQYCGAALPMAAYFIRTTTLPGEGNEIRRCYADREI